MRNIRKESKIPLYSQLMDIIISKIDNGELGVDDKLPSERELADTYEISRHTVRQAIKELENGGYIYSLQGKGTYVSPEVVKHDLLTFYSFTEEMKKRGKKPTSKVLDFEIIHCNLKLQEAMKLNKGEKLYKFTRLRLADNEPMMVETSFVPYNSAPGITKNLLEEKPLYDIFKEGYDINIVSAEETFRAVATRQDEAEILDYGESLPSLLIERKTYSESRIIEYTKTVARGDRFEYSVVLNR